MEEYDFALCSVSAQKVVGEPKRMTKLRASEINAAQAGQGVTDLRWLQVVKDSSGEWQVKGPS